MSLTLSVAGTAIAGAIAPSSIAAQSIASDGDVGFGGFVIDDPSAVIVTTGHKSVTLEESSCSQPRLFTGYLTDRDSGRSAERGMLIDDDRQHEASIVDLNACLNFRHLRGTESERPAETMGARLTWLLGTDQVSGFITGTAFATLYANMMDAANYRGTYPRAVLDDLAGRRANLTYFVFWDPTGTAVSLYFGDDSTGIADSTLYVSNDPVDVNGTTVFPPDTTATLKRSPEEVYSEVTVRYAHGTRMLYRRRPSTATAYVDRGTVIDKPYTGSLTTAQGQAEAFLDSHAIERDHISCTIIVPPESSGLVTAGQRMNVKFTHLDDYTDWTSMRVVSVNVRPLNDVVNRYALDLELELPRAGTAPLGCPDVEPTPSKSWEPLNSLTSTADGDLIYSTTGYPTPNEPAPNNEGNLVFYLLGSAGSPDYAEAAYWGFDIIRVFVTGPGVVTMHTAQTAYGGNPPDPDNGYFFRIGPQGSDESELEGDETYAFGESGSITVPNDEHCAHWVEITGRPPYSTNTYCGFAGADWVLGEVDDEEEQVPPSLPAGSPVEAATDPTPSDDQADGYAISQVWINTTTDDVFILTDNTVGTAVWVQIPQELDDLSDVTTGTPSDGDVLTWDSGTSLWVSSPTAPSVSPATTVTDETTWAITPAVGTATVYARGDHTHGSQANPVTAAALEALGVRGELLVADGTTGQGAIVPTSYVEMSTPDSTTSATLEDISGVSTTITLQQSAHVAAWLNCHVSASATVDYGIAINFDGTDHDEIPTHLTTTDEGNVAVIHRTATALAPGTYTIKGRHRRISGGGTPQTDRADLLVMAMTASGPLFLTNEAEDDYLYANLG